MAVDEHRPEVFCSKTEGCDLDNHRSWMSSSWAQHELVTGPWKFLPCLIVGLDAKRAIAQAVGQVCAKFYPTHSTTTNKHPIV